MEGKSIVNEFDYSITLIHTRYENKKADLLDID